MNIVNKICKFCGSAFSYENTRGMSRIYCSAKCRNKAKKEFLKIRSEFGYGTCVVEGCERPATRKTEMMCEMHYGRIRRNGNTDGRVIKGRYKTAAGYIKVLDRYHVLADGYGLVFEHRLVAFEHHKGVCPKCFWCKKELSWDVAAVDHLDEDKENNEITNLVVTCNACNRARGAVLPFLARMDDEAYSIFIEVATKWRENLGIEGYETSRTGKKKTRSGR